MSKKCQAACNFGAISMSRDRAYIDPEKCKECGKCSQACPYNAIADLMRPCKRSCPVDAISMDENGIVVIDEERCINCGSCIKDCPFGAISDRSFIVDVIRFLKSDVPVYAMVAPAIEGQFGQATMADNVQPSAVPIKIPVQRPPLEKLIAISHPYIFSGAQMPSNAKPLRSTWRVANKSAKRALRTSSSSTKIRWAL